VTAALDEATIAVLAGELARSEDTRRPIGPLTDRFPSLTVADAYRIQLHNIQRRIGGGTRVVGHKIGFTAKAMRDLLGVDEPDFGYLLDDMVLRGGEPIALSGFLYPRIEAEIAFYLSHALKGPGVTVEDVAEAIAWAVPSLELIDSRIADWRIRLPDTIADNASAARVIVGDERRPLAPDHFANCQATVSVDGAVVSSGYGRDVYGSPVRAVMWLVNLLAEYDVGLEAGQLVMPGALHSAVTISRPCTVSAEFDGMGLVTARFVREKQEGTA
jgi:2-keto-4-pentenoate hydratase